MSSQSPHMEKDFWKTIGLLVGRDWVRSAKEVHKDVEDWVDDVILRRDETFFNSINVKVNEINTKSSCTEGDNKMKTFFDQLNLPKLECTFSHPHVRTRLERLMGSNLVSLTDREYMQLLQQKILEDYAKCMAKRIASREVAERDRVKRLVLTGKIPLSQAPPEMDDHPIRLIELYCQKKIEERRAKYKVNKVVIPKYLYWDDTPDPPSGLSIEQGHVFRESSDRLCNPPSPLLDITQEEDIERGYMYADEDFEALQYEDDLVKQMKDCESVYEMYSLADQMIGELLTLDGGTTS